MIFHKSVKEIVKFDKWVKINTYIKTQIKLTHYFDSHKNFSHIFYGTPVSP